MPDLAESPPKILVVDDNEQNRALAQATLDGEGYDVTLASHGEEALRAFKAGPFDCVLLDVRMPGLDGFAVCERLRALPGGVDVPIVFLTAQRDVETFDRALAAGADDFLTKPFRPTELIVRVQSALKMRRMGAELRGHYELIRRQRDDLLRLQLQKEMLTAFVVHDLKNPVGSIDLHAQAIARDRKVPEDARESALQIRAAARNLMRLIQNLLDISKSEEGKLAPKRAGVDLGGLVGEVREVFEVQARDARVSLQADAEAGSIEADPSLIRRVLENLVENAIRHAPQGSTVRLIAEQKDREVDIRVSDEGAGIPPEMRDKVFDRFVQLEGTSAASSRSGRGLGLTFCKLAVEAHGGRIWIEDASPGTVIHMRLPNEG